MKTTGTFLFIATVAALFYSTAAILDLTGSWYVLSVNGLKGPLQHPKCWKITMKQNGTHFEGDSTFFDDQEAETVNKKFKLTRYPYDDVHLYNVVTRSGYPLDFLPFNIQAIDNENGTISLIELTDDKNPEHLFVENLLISRDQELTSDKAIWEFCVLPIKPQH